MADPLSIAASVITVIGAADSIGKSLGKVKTLRNAPAEVLALQNEVSDLRIVLDDVNFCVLDMGSTETSTRITIRLQHLSELVDRAKSQLLQLDKLLHYDIIKPGSLDGEFKVSRTEWLRAQSAVEAIRQSLRDVKLNIATQMMGINS